MIKTVYVAMSADVIQPVQEVFARFDGYADVVVRCYSDRLVEVSREAMIQEAETLLNA